MPNFTKEYSRTVVLFFSIRYPNSNMLFIEWKLIDGYHVESVQIETDEEQGDKFIGLLRGLTIIATVIVNIVQQLNFFNRYRSGLIILGRYSVVEMVSDDTVDGFGFKFHCLVWLWCLLDQLPFSSRIGDCIIGGRLNFLVPPQSDDGFIRFRFDNIVHFMLQSFLKYSCRSG